MKLVLASLMVVALAACTSTQQEDRGSAQPSSAGSVPAIASAPATALPGDVLQTLERYHWQLASATDKAGQRIDALFARTDRPLQLDFIAKGISISNTCNRMHGSYALTDGKLEVGQLASTMMACNDAKLTALDSAAAKYLAGTLAFQLDTTGANPTLALTSADGARLVFDGVATAETRFGSKGETVFLEVAPEAKACDRPAAQDGKCLEVRELHYGANGVREGEPGAWHVLGQDIEGFTHQPGVRNVLRVKQFKVANPPAGASSVAYVLDMVVETELPPRKPQSATPPASSP